jgi:outer membrane protein
MHRSLLKKLCSPASRKPLRHVGRTPWSARVPLNPLFATGINVLLRGQTGEGAGRGPVGPPHHKCKLSTARNIRFAAFFIAAGSLFAQDRPALQLSLRRAVELATSPEGSARIQLSTELTAQAKARSTQARAALLPSLDASVSEQNLNRSLAAFGFSGIAFPIPGLAFPSVVGPFNLFDARANITQSVLDFPSIRRYQASRASIQATKSDHDNTGDQVSAQVAKAYLTALRGAADEETARANVELAEALLKQAGNLKSAGTGTGIEVTRARVQLANEKQRMLVAENERRRGNLQLLRAMNLRLDTEFVLTDRLTYTPVDAGLLAEVKAKAIEARSDFKAQLDRQNSARLASSAVSMERLPSVAAFGDYGSIGSGVSNALPTRTYGIALRVPIFDGGRREGRRVEAESQFRQERIRANDLRDQIDLDVRLAADALQTAEQEVAVAAEGLALAENELEQARRRLDAGVAVSLEVTDAQTRLSRARDNQTVALFHHAQARIDLGQATGSLRRFLP